MNWSWDRLAEGTFSICFLQRVEGILKVPGVFSRIPVALSLQLARTEAITIIQNNRLTSEYHPIIS